MGGGYSGYRERGKCPLPSVGGSDFLGVTLPEAESPVPLAWGTEKAEGVVALLGKTQFGEGSERHRTNPRGGVPPSVCKVHATYAPKYFKCSWALHPHFLSGRSSFNLCFGLPLCSAGRESACNVGDPGSIPGLGRSPGEGKGYPLQDSGQETDALRDQVNNSPRTPRGRRRPSAPLTRVWLLGQLFPEP